MQAARTGLAEVPAPGRAAGVMGFTHGVWALVEGSPLILGLLGPPVPPPSGHPPPAALAPGECDPVVPPHPQGTR